MLKIDYREQDYNGCRIDIYPSSLGEIDSLREMVYQKFMLENPAKTFARNMRNGLYDDLPEEVLEEKAKVINEIADLWEGQPDENMAMILSKALQMLADAVLTL